MTSLSLILRLSLGIQITGLWMWRASYWNANGTRPSSSFDAESFLLSCKSKNRVTIEPWLAVEIVVQFQNFYTRIRRQLFVSDEWYFCSSSSSSPSSAISTSVDGRNRRSDAKALFKRNWKITVITVAMIMITAWPTHVDLSRSSRTKKNKPIIQSSIT